ncbi:four helix bundle protein [Akkermansiaceae bacterium]|nr:four helix bundle protein [Verrucomicrobiaceae bacterium]MDB4730781.1 four helix bundle protein [Akkermansiaceae bacterium]
MKDFRKLQVWQKAHAFVLELYEVSQSFPAQESYGITSQIRRAAVSIPSNIAEGCGREGDPELRRFLVIALGSASETEYQLQLCKDLGFLVESKYHPLNNQLIELKKMLSAFIQKLASGASSPKS